MTDGTTAYGSQVGAELDALGSSVNNIVNAQIASGAAIADTKLAQIATGNKVASTAIVGLGTLVKGDTIYASGNDTLAVLNKGTDGQFWKQASDIPSWAFAFSQYKIVTDTIDTSLSTQDVAYDTFGFKPKLVIALVAADGYYAWRSWGFFSDDGVIVSFGTTTDGTVNSEVATDGLIIAHTSSAYIKGVVKTWDADGFTITWTETSTPDSHTATIFWLGLA